MHICPVHNDAHHSTLTCYFCSNISLKKLLIPRHPFQRWLKITSKLSNISFHVLSLSSHIECNVTTPLVTAHPPWVNLEQSTTAELLLPILIPDLPISSWRPLPQFEAITKMNHPSSWSAAPLWLSLVSTSICLSCLCFLPQNSCLASVCVSTHLCVYV